MCRKRRGSGSTVGSVGGGKAKMKKGSSARVEAVGDEEEEDESDSDEVSCATYVN